MIGTELAETRPKAFHLLLLFISLLAAWAGVNAVWGLTSDSPTQLSSLMASAAPLLYWLCGALTLLVLFALRTAEWKARLVVPITMLLAYVLGVTGAEYARSWIAPAGPLTDRSFFLAPALPMLVVWLSFSQHRRFYPLRAGAWSSAHPHWPLAVTILYVVALAAMCARFVVEAGLLSAEWWPGAATVVTLSTLNGFSEEVLFRGLIFPALVIAVGLRWGIFLQALLFGFLHFGASEAWFGSLASAVVLVLLGALFGYIVARRNGIGAVIGIHALIDIVGLSLLAVSQA